MKSEKYLYYLYCIKNTINNKIYIGVHSTKNINDGYRGSGKQLKYAYEKYGLENFEKLIVFFFDNEEDMYKAEAEIVTTEFINRSDTYNISEGGKPVGISIRRKNGHDSGKKTFIHKTGIYSKEARIKANISLKKYFESDSFKTHQRYISTLANSESANQKRKDTMARNGHSAGSKNSNYGKHWITNGYDNQTVNKDLPIPIGWRKGRTTLKQ